MSSRHLAQRLLGDLPETPDAEGLLRWGEALSHPADGEAARALADLHEAVWSRGIGGGARAMHARFVEGREAPTLDGIEPAEATLLTVLCALAGSTLRDEPPITAEAVLALRDRVLTTLHDLPDLVDELVLEAGRRLAHHPDTAARLNAWGEVLAGAKRWFGGGTGRALAQQGTALEGAWRRHGIHPPRAERAPAWARHGMVVAAAAVLAGCAGA